MDKLEILMTSVLECTLSARLCYINTDFCQINKLGKWTFHIAGILVCSFLKVLDLERVF